MPVPGVRMAVLAAVLCLSGCGGSSVTAGSGSPGSPSAPAATGLPTPSTGQDTRDLQDCGDFDLGQGEAPPATALDCFMAAFREHRPARLAVTRPTVEGDPIPQTFSTGTDGRVTMVTDSRLDNFGTKEVVREICTRVEIADGFLAVSDCSQAERITP